MNMKWFAVLVILTAVLLVGQEKPKPKKVPLYKIVMVCPKGQKLYVQQQLGWKSVPGASDLFHSVIEMTFEWRTWNGDAGLLQSEMDKARCFKGLPPKEPR